MRSYFYAIPILIFCGTALAEDVPFLKRKQEGWFWYKEIFPPDEEEKQEAEPPPAPPAQPTQPSGPAEFSSAWLRENMQHYLDNAQDNPSEENVQAYLLLQHLALQKSLVFADVAQSAVNGHPILDANNDRPISTFGGNALDFQADTARRKLLSNISQEAGLFVFFDSDPLSIAYIKIIEGVTSAHRFTAKFIAMSPPPPGLPVPSVPDGGHAALMGVNSFPSTVLVSPDGRFSVVARAPLSQQELEERILVSARKLKVISDEEFDTARSFKNFPGQKNNSGGTTNNSNLPIQPSEVLKSIGGNYALPN